MLVFKIEKELALLILNNVLLYHNTRSLSNLLHKSPESLCRKRPLPLHSGATILSENALRPDESSLQVKCTYGPLSLHCLWVGSEKCTTECTVLRTSAHPTHFRGGYDKRGERSVRYSLRRKPRRFDTYGDGQTMCARCFDMATRRSYACTVCVGWWWHLADVRRNILRGNITHMHWLCKRLVNKYISNVILSTVASWVYIKNIREILRAPQRI